MKNVLKKGIISFFISAFAGVLVNLIIDCAVNANGVKGFVSMSPDFVNLFPTPVMAAYVNILLYGLIGFTFSVMTFIYDVERIGFAIQSIIYFIVTASVCLAITVILWQLYKYPPAFAGTLAGYGATHVIMFIIGYRTLKKDIKEINEISVEIEGEYERAE
ncbi:MAG: DUF3021 domain-containing protein [Lachnospiraceae bacterium]|nr:DUF3021 domain-containing protein [Lachnospiraceae bacterium]